MKTFCEIFAGTLFAACAFFGLASPASAALSDRPSVDENDFPQNSWNGFKLDVFEVGGRKAVVISPKKPRADKAWAIKPAWFLAFANAERELLNRGFYIAFYDLSYTYASPEALKALDDFYETCRSKYSLAKKVSLIGMSRGGLTSLMWANKHPCKTACVYVDNPVCDSLSISSAEWLDGLYATADRAGLLFSGSLTSSIPAILEAEGWNPNKTGTDYLSARFKQSRRIPELIEFALSDDYLELRYHAGLAMQPSKISG